MHSINGYMKHTKSERLFEEFAQKQGWNISKISESLNKSPDYDVLINCKRMIFEIKEIVENEDDKRNKKFLKEHGYSDVISKTPGQYVRAKIISAKNQLKKFKELKIPMLVVLYDNSMNRTTKLDQYELLVGMYGLESVILAFPQDKHRSPYSVGMKYGTKSQTNKQHNTSISALAVIVEKDNNLVLDIYHNKFASVPLSNYDISGEYISHYRLACGNEPFDRPTWEKSN